MDPNCAFRRTTPNALQRRPYRSKRNRPCMLCRSRKTSCRRAEKDIACITCRKRGQRCSFLDDLTQESGTASVTGGSPNDGYGLDDLGQAGVDFGTSTALPEGLASDVVPGSLEDQANDRFSQYSVDVDAIYGDFTDERIWSSPPPDETQPASTTFFIINLRHTSKQLCCQH
ncbi:uncharacterized protein BDZ83DRAFT_437720 [Colletotrichum acutatum]|uniref:Zn(2)-C6 fungal-type domain-containing protein n=1 Tax=Glomerella acutata TaxID=27357 RepID=A0AAD8XC23_GLOAC|nr:uncharacterized protein BDZ83DRAFT_437720 [Colletotrichum acutatum]KAK1721433.1 hypothetical protein BDZ83DRAFT_437720 [Colletotrichum acutatum]